MAFAVKTKVPGSILVKKMRSGNEYIYYREYKNKGAYKASRLRYNSKNIKVVEQILEHLYKEQLTKENKLDYSLPTEDTTLHQQFELFKQELQRKELSENTLYEYQHSFNLIVRKEYSPDEYKAVYENGRERKKYKIEEEIEAYIKSTDHKNNTINKNLRQIQVFINYLATNNEIPPINIYKKYKVKPEPKEITPYSKEEAEQILEYAKEKDEILYLLLMLMYLTGGRVTEWLRAYFGKGQYNVDLEKKTIKFKNKVRSNQFQILPMSERVEAILIRLADLEKSRNDFKGKVIPYPEKGKSNVIKAVTKIEIELGIKKKGRSTHGFRRLLATELFEKQIPLDIIKDIMRHSSIDVTLNHYRKYDKNRITDSLDKLDR